MRRGLLCLATLLVLATPARADFSAGLRAYDGGDYATARAEWEPLAAAGDGDALIALAGLYRQGLGIRADLNRAIRLYRRAAQGGNPVAQVNLGEIHQLGLAGAVDLRAAYFWYELAARQGHSWAIERLKQIGPRLAPAARAEAAQRADVWSLGLDPAKAER